MMNNMREIKTLRIPLYILFGVFYLMNTQFKIPNGTTLRWVVLFSFMAFCLINNKSINFKVISSSPMIVFVLIMIPSIAKLMQNNAMLFKALSIYVVIISFAMLFQKASIDEIEQIFIWFCKFICFTVVINAPLIFNRGFYLGGRFRGILKNANGCSCIAMMAMICALYMASSSERISKRHRYIIITIFSYIEVIMSQSRMGFAAATLALIILIIFLMAKGSSVKALSITALILVLSIAAYFLVGQLNLPVVERFIENSMERKAWQYAYARIEEAPIFGHGYGASAFHQDNVYESTYWTFFSSYLELIVDTGYYGLIVFGVYMVNQIRKMIKVAFSNTLLTVLVTYIICLLIAGYTESFMFSVGNPISIYFWFIVILAEIYYWKLTEEESMRNISD